MSYPGSKGKTLIVPDSRPERWSAAGTTYRTGEGNIKLSEIQAMDVIRLWLKPYHALYPSRRAKKPTLEHVFRRSTGGHRGYQVNELQGSVHRVDIDGQTFEVNVSPGAHGFQFDFTGMAYVPWLSLRRAEIVRTRIVEGTTVPRYPLILPIVFEE